MKLLDLERKGNVVRFYLGADDLEKWWGDDWNDAPYEDNAGTVYEKFVSAEVDAAFPFNCSLSDAYEILQEEESLSNKRWMPKEHYIKVDEPFLIAIPDEPYGIGWCSWEYIKDTPGLQSFYLGMPWEECHKAIKAVGGYLLDGRDMKNDETKGD